MLLVAPRKSSHDLVWGAGWRWSYRPPIGRRKRLASSSRFPRQPREPGRPRRRRSRLSAPVFLTARRRSTELRRSPGHMAGPCPRRIPRPVFAGTVMGLHSEGKRPAALVSRNGVRTRLHVCQTSTVSCDVETGLVADADARPMQERRTRAGRRNRRGRFRLRYPNPRPAVRRGDQDARDRDACGKRERKRDSFTHLLIPRSARP